jgi:hypothetical protein
MGGTLNSYTVPRIPVLLPPIKRTGHIVTGPEADTLVEQFLTGERLTLRMWVSPDCEAKTDINIWLEGFAATWKRFEAKTKE